MSNIQLRNVSEAENILYTIDREKLPFSPTYTKHPLVGTETRSVPFTANFGETTTVKIPMGAHFITDITLRIELPALTPSSGSVVSWTNAIGFALIQSVQLTCEDVVIDTINSYTLDFEDEFDKEGTGALAGKEDIFNSMNERIEPRTIYIPLKFWFTRRLDQALPVGCIDDKLHLVIRLRKLDGLVLYDGDDLPNVHGTLGATAMVKYHWVDDVLFRSFKRRKLNYVIQKRQFASYKIPSTTEQTLSLDLEGPIRKLRWAFVDDASLENNDYFNYNVRTQGSIDPSSSPASVAFMDSATLRTAGNEVLTGDEIFFRKLSTARPNTSTRSIYSIDFDVKYVPSTLNFSRADDCVLDIKYRDNSPSHRVMLVAYSYGFLSIEDGCITTFSESC